MGLVAGVALGVTKALRGARVRRVMPVGECAIALELSGSPLRGALLCSVERSAQGIGLVDSIAPSLGGSAALQTLRALLEGARFEGFTRAGTNVVRLDFTRSEQSFALVLEWFGAGAIALVRAGTEVLFRLGRPKLELDVLFGASCEAYEPAESLEELRADGERLAPLLAAVELEARKSVLLKSLRTQVKRRERRLAAVAGDAARAAEADTLRLHASLLLANLHTLRDARGEVALLDYNLEPPAPRTIQIDPKLGARKQADAWFDRARRLQRGVALAEQRAIATQAEQSALFALCAEVENATSIDALTSLVESARAFGVAPSQSAASSASRPAGRKGEVRVPYREFRGAGERAIWVGRGAGDNDALTLHHARPHDLWLHARDTSGAHVIVPLERNEACPPELLSDAATLAAHFSSARGEPGVDVIYTPRRYIQKPRKSAPGSVLLLREKVFRLILEPTRLRRLLDHELAPNPQASRA